MASTRTIRSPIPTYRTKAHIGGVFWYFTWRQQSDPALVFISAAIGALAINLFHAFVWRTNPEFYKRRQK